MLPGLSSSMGRCGLPDLSPAGPWPLQLLRDPEDPGSGRVIELDEQDEELRDEQPVIFCRACQHTVTTGDQRIEVAGSHRHTFFNPAGIVYEIGCFATAAGCGLVGETSNEFSWFAGYLWQIAICGGCGTHLGWRFQSADSTFFGLILPKVGSGPA